AWNPAKWKWTDLPTVARKVMAGQRHKDGWSCGNRQTIEIGSRVFLIRQGQQGHRGIVGSAFTTDEVYEDEHWDPESANAGKRTHYVRFVWDRLIDVAIDPVLDRSDLDEPPLDMVDSWRRSTNY